MESMISEIKIDGIQSVNDKNTPVVVHILDKSTHRMPERRRKDCSPPPDCWTERCALSASSGKVIGSDRMAVMRINLAHELLQQKTTITTPLEQLINAYDLYRKSSIPH